ncbi:hypothetical protein [Sphingomonas sp. Leaf231]|uniref:hypothetical protein n=1 Tax=Sphingomonas sp. Leaf231 TaxID=1736301 RepID=UPI0012E17021|nr:hypothetical protein [Sphingomonas sp. Leaf231]
MRRIAQVEAMEQYSQEWVAFPQAVANLVAQTGDEEAPIGGRFICSEGADEELMWSFLEAQGLTLRGFGQCEVVAMRTVRVSNTAIGEMVEEMRQIASGSGYRLQSIEAGDVDSGEASVLACEVGYVPWWQSPP